MIRLRGLTNALIAVLSLVAGPTTDGKGPKITLSHSAYELALEGESRLLGPSELDLVRNDILARYTFLRFQVERALRGHHVQELGAPADERTRDLPLTAATERLVELIAEHSSSPTDFAVFARDNGIPGCCAVYIALRGNLSKEVEDAFTKKEFDVQQNSIGKYFNLVRREPPASNEKLPFYLKEFSWAAPSGAVALRVAELRGVVVDELAAQMQTRAKSAVETDSDLDTLVLGLTVLGALGDQRLAAFPVQRLIECPQLTEQGPARRNAYRRYYDGALARKTGRRDLRMTKSFKFLEWSQSLPLEVQFTQSD